MSRSSSLTPAVHEFKSVIEEFMTCFEDPKVSTLAELVEWNAKHAEEAMPERTLVEFFCLGTPSD